jgi:hypothetical protein
MDKIPDHETIERWVELQPLDTMKPLPDCTESREARRLIREASKLAHQVVERVEAQG